MNFFRKWFGVGRTNTPARPFETKEVVAIKVAAAKGDMRAKSTLGRMYFKGEGVPQNYLEAAFWLNAAVDAGDADAQRLLDMAYEENFSVGRTNTPARPFETKEAVAIKVAATKGDVRAKSMLGSMYFKGEGVPQNYLEAAFWLNAAAEAGDADAQGLLGMAYEEGFGVDQDFSKAAALYRKAADQGVDAAAYFLAKLFLEGKGVAKDTTVAIKWFLTSARAGNTGAQGVLLALYMYGEGVPVNAQEAYFWALLAAREKHPLALQLMPKITSTLTSQRRAEIEQRVRDWKPIDTPSERSTASVRQKHSRALEMFAEEIESWPIDQAKIALQLIEAIIHGDSDEIDRISGALTVGHFGAVMTVVNKMEQGD